MKHSPYVPLVHVNLGNICDNYRHLCGILDANGQKCGTVTSLPDRDGGEVPFTWPAMLSVIKSDAYGHGHIEVARALMEREGASIFASGRVQEAAELRQGIEEPNGGHPARRGHPPRQIISLLGPVGREDIELCEDFGIIPVIHTFEQLPLLDLLRKNLPVAIKCNSGMARLGFGPDDLRPLIERLRKLPKVVPVLAVSQLASADSDDGAVCIRIQATLFFEMLSALREHWPDIAVSLCNSAGVLQARIATEIIGPHICRAGLSLYGGNPLHGTALAHLGEGLKWAMNVSVPVITVRRLAPGEGLGYGHTFVARKEMRIGIVAAGYADCLSRGMSNHGMFCASGVRVPVLGRISMEMTAIDLSEVSGLGVGDRVWLMGGPYESALSPEDLASAWGTISYEVLCLLGSNIRVYDNIGPA